MTFTQHDLRDQVKATVAAYVDAYDYWRHFCGPNGNDYRKLGT